MLTLARNRKSWQAGAAPDIFRFLIILFLTFKLRKATFSVIWLQNTFFFFKKYEVDLILFVNHSAHTYDTKQIFPPQKLNPP